MALPPSFATSAALRGFRPNLIDTQQEAAAPTVAATGGTDLTNRLLQIMGGNLSGTLTGGEKLSALGALLKSVSRGSQTSPQDVMRSIQQQKLQEVQGALQIQELRKQAIQQAQTEASLQSFASRLSNQDRAVFDGLPLAEKIKWATRGETAQFNPVTAELTITSGPNRGSVIGTKNMQAVAGQDSEGVSASPVGRPNTLATFGGVAGRYNEKGVWEPLPTRANFVTETRMINGKPTLVQVDTSTGKWEEVKPAEISEGERKIGFLAQRAASALRNIKKITSETPEAGRPSFGAEAIRGIFGETAANAFTPSARQQVEANQLNALDALLTIGTGQAYNKEQLEGYRKTYFAQLGDSPETAAAKRRAFEEVVQQAKAVAGKNAYLIDEALYGKPSAPKTPKSGGAKTFTIGGKQFTISPKG